MGREIKRVPMDFDWPLHAIWPGYLLCLCNDDMAHAIRKPGATSEETCEACRHFGRLAGLAATPGGCPETTIDPPAGDGWQLWETVTEGSPVSPVFATPEQLARWLVQPGNDTSITRGTSYAVWLRMIEEGWAMSMVMSNGRLQSGVEFIGTTPATPGKGEK